MGIGNESLGPIAIRRKSLNVPSILIPAKDRENAETNIIETPLDIQEVKTPEMLEFELTESAINSSSGTAFVEDSQIFQERLSNSSFCNFNDENVSQILKKVRTENINCVIISHLNVIFFAPKLHSIKAIFTGNLDVMVFTETKIDPSYPISQFKIGGFKKPYRLDRNAFGGGILIYVRQDIPSNQLKIHTFAANIVLF